ncbi:PaaI family thioesterase [Granulicoccus phenolivorans]|uniref:PaaI family thioesterase n=1 Tax=Granulicoccus phenolivorans TaxID=266854 RepID=UPI000423B1EC|nr:PaaI family thioesterase [Granulicoccus phenolivorans]
MTEPSAPRMHRIDYHPPELDKQKVFGRSGLAHLQAMAAGEIPAPPISAHIGLGIVSVTEGDVVMTAEPHESHYNPIGSVHGGFFAILLDSVCGCAVHSTLPAGVGYTTLELKVSFLRGITADTGTVTAHGWVTKPGRSAAFAEGDIRDSDGRVLATASSTLLVMGPAGA